MQIPRNPKYTQHARKNNVFLVFLCILGLGESAYIISGKHAKELYADFYMPPKASELWHAMRPPTNPVDGFEGVAIDSSSWLEACRTALSGAQKTRILMLSMTPYRAIIYSSINKDTIFVVLGLPKRYVIKMT